MTDGGNMAERGENALIVLVGQPTIVTNSTIAGIIDEAAESGQFAGVFGALNGIAGVLDGKLVDLDAQKHKTIEGLKHTPGSVLSGRHRVLDTSEAATFIEVLTANEIGTVFVLGGQSAPGVLRYLQNAAAEANYPLIALGAPLCAQNDVNIGDHTVGFGSAARFVANATRDAARDAASSEEVITVLEFPGQHSGWLTAASALARSEQFPAPHAIVLPESPKPLETVVDEVRRAYHKYGHALAVTASGAKSNSGEALDGPSLAAILAEQINVPTRFERIGSLARSSQNSAARGDVEEAYHLGVLLVRLATDDISGYFAALQRDGLGSEKGGYKSVDGTVRLDQIDEAPRVLPKEYIAENGFGPSDAFLSWLRPLVGSQVSDYVSLEL
jgi:6-phosphofructokinase 1